MWRVLVYDIECRRLRSCIDDSCTVCYAMTIRNKKKVTRTFQVDCAQYLRDLVGTFLPFTSLPLTVLPIPYVPAPTRPVFSSIMTALVHVAMMDTPCYA